MTDFEKEIIKKIEFILLDGKSFDDERINILLDFRNSFQVQACPGSGKTTLLVAKLMFLAQTIDFSKESICILTHTNVAIDEIKRKIKKHNKSGYEDFINKVYKLFDYPNYIGTIQGFLDKYLGIPGYIKQFKKKPNFIGDEFLDKNFLGVNYNILTNKLEVPNDKNYLIKKEDTKRRVIYKKFNYQIQTFGKLSYREIDYFSLKYLQESENIKNLLQKRFKYVFLDEIQDTHSLHIEILNKLYNGSTNNIIQGFGDYNQEIFDDGVDGGNFTIYGGEKPKQINNSLRLSSIIAENVKNVCIKPQSLKGINGRDIPIYFIIFDKPEDVIQKYLEIIEKHKDCFVGIEKDDLIFKAVGWVHKEKENGKLSVGSYWKKYNNGKITKNKSNLFSYFQKVDEKVFKNKGYSVYKDNIINGILHAFNQNKDNQILYKFNDKDGNEKEKHFSKTTFIDYLKKNDLYNKFQENIFKYANQIQGDNGINCEEVRTYILNLEINGRKVKDDSFLRNDNFGTSKEITNFSTDNKYKDNNIKIGEIETNIEFATIAKVKGETHTGILILDTNYKNESNKRILENWDKEIEYTKGGEIAKSLKNYYVAITRASHLLCIAIYKKSLEKCKSKYSNIFELENIEKIYI